jgi:hypothetical protein
MTSKSRSAGLSIAGTRGSPEDSPILQGLRCLTDFFQGIPEPDLGDQDAKMNGTLCGTHLLHLVRGCGLLNGSGFHSAAVSLLRPMEDALDCYAAIILVPGAAKDWQSDKLKASEAGKKWIGSVKDFTTHDNIPLDEYRKRLRNDFNLYAHGNHALCLWNLFFQPYETQRSDAKVEGTLEINLMPGIIDSNGHAIDAFETAHILEFIAVTQLGYTKFLSTHPELRDRLTDLLPKIEEIMMKHHAHRCQEVRFPPELAHLDR